MRIEVARDMAERLMRQLKPYCERIEIAGSIRRRCKEVKDIELVVIPIWETRERQVGLFEETEQYQVNVLHEFLTGIENRVRLNLNWIKTGTDDIVPWEIKANGRYWRGLITGHYHETKLDLFLTDARRWGATMAIRTGSADFSHELVKFAARYGCKFDKGCLFEGDTPRETPEETDVFEILKAVYVPPQLRKDARYLRRKEVV